MDHSISRHLKPINIAAHRGSCGGNIPPNTFAAYETALGLGANILETDVARSSDGVFYMFHTGSGNEKYYLGIDCAFEDMTSKELDQIFLNNELGKDTLYRLPRLDEMLARFKNRCVINLDRSWEYWEEILPMVRKMDMVDQILLKSPCRQEWIDKAASVAPDFAYMPIVTEDITPFYEMGGDRIPGFIGAELVFATEDSPILRDNTVEMLHRSGKIAWGNSIQFSAKKILSAGHNDDLSLTGNPENGWGWLVRQGFDIIQTDWVGPLKLYLETLSFF